MRHFKDKVSKIETVQNCYIAVSGCLDRRKDHALQCLQAALQVLFQYKAKMLVYELNKVAQRYMLPSGSHWETCRYLYVIEMVSFKLPTLQIYWDSLWILDVYPSVMCFFSYECLPCCTNSSRNWLHKYSGPTESRRHCTLGYIQGHWLQVLIMLACLTPAGTRCSNCAWT
jgi:hypothetical protein